MGAAEYQTIPWFYLQRYNRYEKQLAIIMKQITEINAYLIQKNREKQFIAILLYLFNQWINLRYLNTLMKI